MHDDDPALSPPSATLRPLSGRSEKSFRLPDWRLPPGVAPGTWEYTQRDSIANDYAEFLKNTPLIRLDLAFTLDALGTATGDATVIDLGCGDGRALRAMAGAGYRTLGVDMSQAMLNRVTSHEQYAAGRCGLIRANLVQLEGIRGDVADHAICLFSTLGMIRGRTHRRRFLCRVNEIVKPGGRFVLHVHNRNDAWRDRASTVAYAKSLWLAVRRRDHELGDRVYPYRGLADMFLHAYSLSELRRDLRASGWGIQSILPLSRQSDCPLSRSGVLPSVRAGGFIAIAHSKK